VSSFSSSFLSIRKVTSSEILSKIVSLFIIISVSFSLSIKPTSSPTSVPLFNISEVKFKKKNLYKSHYMIDNPIKSCIVLYQ
jgi:hypothetical protein